MRALLVLPALFLLAGCGGSHSATSTGQPAALTTTAASGATGTTQLGPGSGSPAPSAETLQERFVQVVKDVEPEVVQIETNVGLGSGIVFDDHGDIVTNDHVVAGANHFVVTVSSGDTFKATLVGTFKLDDLALIHVDGANLKPATFADSSKLDVGDIVLALGNPLGLRSSVTEGIVSALGRTESEQNGVAIPDVIQTSAAINPGNSGGALVDLQGRVIGIPTLTAGDPEFGGAPAPGIGFAIPSNTVSDIAGQLASGGRVAMSRRAYLGIFVSSITGGQGVYVRSVQQGGPAAKAGIKRGDLIVAVDGKPTPSAAELAMVLANLQPGTTIPVKIARPSTHRTLSVSVDLGQFPASS